MYPELPLFQPKDVQSSATYRLLRRANDVYNLGLQSYHDLYQWSCSHLDLFWGLVWDETTILGHKGIHVVDNSALPVQNPAW